MFQLRFELGLLQLVVCFVCEEWGGGTWSRVSSDHVTVYARLWPVCIYRRFRVFLQILVDGGNRCRGLLRDGDADIAPGTCVL